MSSPSVSSHVLADVESSSSLSDDQGFGVVERHCSENSAEVETTVDSETINEMHAVTTASSPLIKKLFEQDIGTCTNGATDDQVQSTAETKISNNMTVFEELELSSGVQNKAKITSSEDLQQAFHAFNQLSEQLNQSYDYLQKRVEQLSGELARVSAQRLQELAEKEQLADRLQSLLHMLPAGVLLLDENGHVVDSNHAADDLLLATYQRAYQQTYQQSAVVNHPTAKIGHVPLTNTANDPDLDSRTGENLPDSLIGERWVQLIQHCFQPRHDDGHEISLVDGRRVNLRTTAMMNERGQLILLTDMTETRRLQAQLSQHERLSAMGKMVASLAHQIRTPLSAATLYADHLCDPELSFQHRLKFSEKLKERLQHLESQVQDMLIFSRGDAPMEDVISVAELVAGIYAAAEVPLAHYNAQCQWPEISPLLQQQSLRCNADALISSIMNLINNSLESCQQPIQLILEVELLNSQSNTGNEKPVTEIADSLVKIRVKDNGPGLTDIQQQQVIEPFFTTKPNGTGLGLAVVQAVVRAHRGEFHISSHPEGGVMAELTLPMAASRNDSNSNSSHSSGSHSSGSSSSNSNSSGFSSSASSLSEYSQDNFIKSSLNQFSLNKSVSSFSVFNHSHPTDRCCQKNELQISNFKHEECQDSTPDKKKIYFNHDAKKSSASASASASASPKNKIGKPYWGVSLFYGLNMSSQKELINKNNFVCNYNFPKNTIDKLNDDLIYSAFESAKVYISKVRRSTAARQPNSSLLGTNKFLLKSLNRPVFAGNQSNCRSAEQAVLALHQSSFRGVKNENSGS